MLTVAARVKILAAVRIHDAWAKRENLYKTEHARDRPEDADTAHSFGIPRPVNS